MIRSTELLDLASTLANGTSEVQWRAAISRAYYAAFHQARDFFQSLGFDVPRSDTAHAFFWRRLENSGNKSLRQAGTALVLLRRQRNRADYDVEETVIQRDAHGAITNSAETIRAINSLGHDDRRAAVDVIKAYERDVLRETTWRPRPR